MCTGNQFAKDDRVRVKDSTVPASSGASWQNGMMGTIVDSDGREYLVRLSNGQQALFSCEELERLQ